MAVQRRYKAGVHKNYDETYKNAIIGSHILNSGDKVVNSFTLIVEKRNIEEQLYLLLGDENGYLINKENQEVPAELTYWKRKIQDAEDVFSALNQDRINRGEMALNEMPHDLLKNKLFAEAYFDVSEKEVEHLKKQMKRYEAAETEERKGKLLNGGPRGSGQLKMGILAVLDGQLVKVVDEVLYIVDEASPYNGMRVVDYRSLVSKPWLQAKELMLNEKRSLGQRLHSEFRYSDLESEWAEYANALIKQKGWEDLFCDVMKGKPLMPKVPKDIKLLKK